MFKLKLFCLCGLRLEKDTWRFCPPGILSRLHVIVSVWFCGVLCAPVDGARTPVPVNTHCEFMKIFSQAML